MFLLDTNVLSELRVAQRCDPGVRHWQADTPTDACFISVLTQLEIRCGIEKVQRTDEAFAEALNRWLETSVTATFAGRILPVSSAIADRAGRIAAGRTRGLADCLIAATALEHRLILATRNLSDFEDIAGLQIVDPWDGPQP